MDGKKHRIKTTAPQANSSDRRMTAYTERLGLVFKRSTRCIHRFHPYARNVQAHKEQQMPNDSDEDHGKVVGQRDETNGRCNGLDGGDLLDCVSGWKERNSSLSEAIIKAERYGCENDDVKKLQKKTVDHVMKKKTNSQNLQN